MTQSKQKHWIYNLFSTILLFVPQFRFWNIKPVQGRALPVQLCDTMGLDYSDKNGVSEEDLMSTIMGHVQKDYVVCLCVMLCFAFWRVKAQNFFPNLKQSIPKVMLHFQLKI